ncbi:HesA/MoeB/ThiF family protein [Thermosinus carboxydivorans]|uniref:HesA/MoeB/ThiF family protein n=1 Tax=Thermosinus carboxydivorans TaxID=261685 RepID=UPI0012EA8B43|nr:ThiF family adenylyltransferase [Thermosinus carboxydivorans]
MAIGCWPTVIGSVFFRRSVVVKMKDGAVPERYQRNIGTIGAAGQARLLASTVAIVGAGGLGGLVVELLARAGVGRLKIIDGDNFALHNLNRQILATMDNIGQNKAVVAAARVAAINPDVEAIAVPCMLDEKNAQSFLAGVQVVVDALDNIKTRLVLAAAAARLGLPLVHGAIAGCTGQVMTVFPGDPGLAHVYRGMTGAERGVEALLGNPAPTPALAAALQAQEVIKILTGLGQPIRNKLLYFDTEQNIFEFFHFA